MARNRGSHAGAFFGGFGEGLLKAMQLGMMAQHYQAMEKFWDWKMHQGGAPGDVFRKGWENTDPHGADAGAGGGGSGGGGQGAATAARLAGDMMQKYGLTREQAVGAVGTMGYETGNFTTMQEQNPQSGRGGLGYAQWTDTADGGTRRTDFEKYVQQNKLDPNSYEANWGNIQREIDTNPQYAKAIEELKKENTIEGAARSWETHYEGMTPGGPGKPAFEQHSARAVAYGKYLPQDLSGGGEAAAGRVAGAGGGGAMPASVDASKSLRVTDNADASALHPAFASRLERASAAAEQATGVPLTFNSLKRSTAEQAQIRAEHEKMPGGVKEHPAAEPGHSEHEAGGAGDANSSPALEWLRATGPDGRQNIERFGLEFLKGDTYTHDPNHIQLPKSDFGKTVRADQSFKPYQVAGAMQPPESDAARAKFFADHPEAVHGPGYTDQFSNAPKARQPPAREPLPTPPSTRGDLSHAVPGTLNDELARPPEGTAIPPLPDRGPGPGAAPNPAPQGVLNLTKDLPSGVAYQPYESDYPYVPGGPAYSPLSPVTATDRGPSYPPPNPSVATDRGPPYPPPNSPPVASLAHPPSPPYPTPPEAGFPPQSGPEDPEIAVRRSQQPPYEVGFPGPTPNRIADINAPLANGQIDPRRFPTSLYWNPQSSTPTGMPAPTSGRVPEMMTPTVGGPDERLQPAPPATGQPVAAVQPPGAATPAAIPTRPGWGVIDRPNMDAISGPYHTGRGPSGGPAQMGAFDFSTLWGPNPPLALRGPTPAPQPAVAQPVTQIVSTQAPTAGQAIDAPVPPVRPQPLPMRTIARPVPPPPTPVTPAGDQPPEPRGPVPNVVPGSGGQFDPNFGHQFVQNDASDDAVDQSMMSDEALMAAQMPLAVRKGGAIPRRPTLRYASGGGVTNYATGATVQQVNAAMDSLLFGPNAPYSQQDVMYGRPDQSLAGMYAANLAALPQNQQDWYNANSAAILGYNNASAAAGASYTAPTGERGGQAPSVNQGQLDLANNQQAYYQSQFNLTPPQAAAAAAAAQAAPAAAAPAAPVVDPTLSQLNSAIPSQPSLTNTSSTGGTVTGITGLPDTVTPVTPVNPAISSTDTTQTPATTTKPLKTPSTTVSNTPGDPTDFGTTDPTKKGNTGSIGGNYSGFQRGGAIPRRPTLRYASGGAIGFAAGGGAPTAAMLADPGWQNTASTYTTGPNSAPISNQQLYQIQQSVNADPPGIFMGSYSDWLTGANNSANPAGASRDLSGYYGAWSAPAPAAPAPAAPTPVAPVQAPIVTPTVTADTNTSATGGTVTGITNLPNTITPAPPVNPAISSADTTQTPATTVLKAPSHLVPNTTTDTGGVTDIGDITTPPTPGMGGNYSGFRRGGAIPARPPRRGYASGGGVTKFAAGGASPASFTPTDTSTGVQYLMDPNYVGPTMSGEWTGSTPYSALAPNQQAWADQTSSILANQKALGQADAMYWSAGGTNPEGVNGNSMQYWSQITPMPNAVWPSAPAAPAPAAPTPVAPAQTPITSPVVTSDTNTSSTGGTVTGITGLPDTVTPVTPVNPAISSTDTTQTSPTKINTPSHLVPNTTDTSGGTVDQGSTDYGNQNYGIGGNYSGFQRGGAIPARATLRVTRRYDLGGDVSGGGVSPSPMGMPPGLSGGGGGGTPIPPVYFNPATYSGAGAPIGKGITNTSMPTYVAGAVPTLPLRKGGRVVKFQHGGAVGYRIAFDDGGEVTDMPSSTMYEDNMISQDEAGAGGAGGEGWGFQIPSEEVAMGYGSGMRAPSMGGGMRGPGMGGGKPAPGQTEAGFVDEGNPFQRQGGGSGAQGGGYAPTSPQEHDPNLPAWTPQVDDGQGNPSRGVIGAIAGGLHYIAHYVGLDGSGNASAIASDPNTQQARMNFANGQQVDGSPLPTDQEWHAIGRIVDPNERLSNGIRNLGGMEAVRNWYLLQGQATKANQMSAAMLQYSVQLGMKYGDQAVARFYNNDLQGSIHALENAKDAIADGTLINANINYAQDGKTPISVNVAGTDLNGKALWKQTVAPQAILGAALGMRDGTLPWHMYEMAAAKYDPATKAIIDARKANSAAEAETGVLKGMYGDQGAQGEQPTGRGGAGGFATPPGPRRMPLQMPTPQIITAQAPPAPQPAQAPGPGAMPSRPTLTMPPDQMSPLIRQETQGALGGTGGGAGGDRAPEAAPPPDQDQQQQQAPAGPTMEAGADLNKQLANAPDYNVQDVKDEDILAAVRSRYREDNGDFIGAPQVLGRPDQQPGYTRLAPAQQSEMWRGYNASVQQRRQFDGEQARQENQEISYQRERARGAASDLRHGADQKRADWIRTQTDIWKENQATLRNNRSIAAEKEGKDYADLMSRQHPLTPEETNKVLGVDANSNPMVFTHLASAFIPDVGRNPIKDEDDARARLNDAGIDPSLQNVIGPAFKAAVTYSTQTPREEVARGVMLLATGHQTPPGLPAKLNKRLDTYDITVLDDNGYATHLTIPRVEALNLYAVGQHAAGAIEDKRVANVTKLGESQSWPTPPAPAGGGAIPSQATPPKPFVLSPRPDRFRYSDLPPRVPNAEVPQEWKDQFPELNQ